MTMFENVKNTSNFRLYWCKNVGALIVFVVVFLQCQYIVLGIMIAFGVMVIAQFVLVLGRNYYTTVEPEGIFCYFILSYLT